MKNKGYKGNQNAVKHPDVGAADTTLNIRVNHKHKAGWYKAAEKSELSLTQWIIRELNKSSDS